MNKIKEFIIKYKAYIAVFIIAYLLGISSGGNNVRTETKIVEKPVVETKEIEKRVEVLPPEYQDQLEACQKVIDIDEQALTTASNIITTFSNVIPFIASGDVAEINKATGQVKSYTTELTKLSTQKGSIIGTCKS